MATSMSFLTCACVYTHPSSRSSHLGSCKGQRRLQTTSFSHLQDLVPPWGDPSSSYVGTRQKLERNTFQRTLLGLQGQGKDHMGELMLHWSTRLRANYESSNKSHSKLQNIDCGAISCKCQALLFCF